MKKRKEIVFIIFLQSLNKLINCYFLDTVKRNIPDLENYLDLSFSRPGQDVRYAISCEPLRKLGWEPKKDFEKELPKIIKHYKDTWRW